MRTAGSGDWQAPSAAISWSACIAQALAPPAALQARRRCAVGRSGNAGPSQLCLPLPPRWRLAGGHHQDPGRSSTGCTSKFLQEVAQLYSVAGRKMSRSSKYVRRRRAKMGPCPCGGGERRGASVGSGRPAGRPRASRGQGTVPRIIELLFVVLGWWAGRVGGQWCSTQRAAVQPLSGPPTSLPQAAHTEVRPAGCGSRGGTVLRNAQQGAASTACRPPPSCCCYPSRRPAGLALTCPLPSGRHPSHPPLHPPCLGISTPSYSLSIMPTSLCAASTKPVACERALSSAGQVGMQGRRSRGAACVPSSPLCVPPTDPSSAVE